VRARDLAIDYPTVALTTSAFEAARLLAGANLPGLIVVDDRGRPHSVLPGTQVLKMAIPQYCQEDPALARVIDEAHADTFLRDLADRTVAECLPEKRPELPVVDADATVLEVAAVMAAMRSPLVAVITGPRTDGNILGAITLDVLLDRMLAE